MKNASSFLLVALALGFGAFAIVAGPAVEPNRAGLDKCVKLHPVRHCRIANGFPVPKLDSSAQLSL